MRRSGDWSCPRRGVLAPGRIADASLAIWYFTEERSLERLYTVLFRCGAGWMGIATLLFGGGSRSDAAPRLSESFSVARDERGIHYACVLRYASVRGFLILFVPGALLLSVSAVLWRLSG